MTIILFSTSLFVFQDLFISNVFDEMYYSVLPSIWWKRTNTSFGYPQIEGINYHDEVVQLSEYKILQLHYAKKYLLENQSITINIDKEDRQVAIYANIEPSSKNETYHNLIYIYDLKTKTLEIKFILSKYKNESPDQTSMVLDEKEKKDEDTNYIKEKNITSGLLEKEANNYLYNIIFSDWFNGNKGESKFSMNELGDVKIKHKYLELFE